MHKHMLMPCTCQGALLAQGVPEQLLQLLLQAEPGPNQQRLLEALHCLSSRPASDTLSSDTLSSDTLPSDALSSDTLSSGTLSSDTLLAPLCSPACVARLLLLASDAELMSSGDRVRLLTALLDYGSTLLWLHLTMALLIYGSTHQVRLLTATLLVKFARETPTALLLAHGQNELCAFAETAMATGDTAALGAGLKVLSTVRETLARAAASASVSGDGEVGELFTTHRTRKLLRTLRADCGVGEAVRGQARQLQHATRHGKHGQHGKQAAAMEDKDVRTSAVLTTDVLTTAVLTSAVLTTAVLTSAVLTTAVLTMEDREGKTAGRRRDPAGISAPEVSMPEISAPEVSAPEISKPEVSMPEPEVLLGRTEVLSRRSSSGDEVELPWEMREMREMRISPEAVAPPVGEHAADDDTGRASSGSRWPAPAAASDVPQPQPQPQPAEGMSQTSCHAKEPPKPRPRPLGALGAGVNSPRRH